MKRKFLFSAMIIALTMAFTPNVNAQEADDDDDQVEASDNGGDDSDDSDSNDNDSDSNDSESSVATETRERWNPPANGFVDLGLPSGTLWCSYNLGATNVWDYGDFFAWGERTAKSTFTEANYGYKDDPTDTGRKHKDEESGIMISEINYFDLDDKHDAVVENMGKPNKMPNFDNWKELENNTHREWVGDYDGHGVAGMVFYKKKSDNNYSYLYDVHIFLPAAGIKVNNNTSDKGSKGYYWSSSNTPNPKAGRNITMGNGYYNSMGDANKTEGLSVRAVRK